MLGGAAGVISSVRLPPAAPSAGGVSELPDGSAGRSPALIGGKSPLERAAGAGAGAGVAASREIGAAGGRRCGRSGVLTASRRSTRRGAGRWKTGFSAGSGGMTVAAGATAGARAGGLWVTTGASLVGAGVAGTWITGVGGTGVGAAIFGEGATGWGVAGTLATGDAGAVCAAGATLLAAVGVVGPRPSRASSAGFA